MDKCNNSREIENWPDTQSGQIEVMLLGVYHMNNPDADVWNLEADNVLTPERQTELEELTDRLADWDPTRICAEFPVETQSEIDDEYEQYRSGDGLDVLDAKEELVQIGFRLADRLNHEHVYGIDHHIFHQEFPDAYSDDFAEWWNGNQAVSNLVRYPIPIMNEKEERYQEKLDTSTVSEFLYYLNQEVQLDEPSTKFGLLGWENPDGVKYIAQWMERNIRIVHNLATTVNPGDDSILLIIGSGHVPDLRYLLDRTPMFSPSSPLSVLS